LQTDIPTQADTEFGKQNDCRPVQFKVPFKWPLAVDIVKRGLQANSKKRLLALFSAFFDDLGPNVEATVLGGRGFVTMDPENIEAVLSSRFQGTLMFQSWTQASDAKCS